MDYTAFIFARGGSKGLPGKNIKLLAGKPLIAWSIEQALAVSRVKQVIVSTDSSEIAAVAKAYGAIVPFLRPPELARDDSPEWLSWRHALLFLKDQAGAFPTSMISLPATAPLRTIADIDRCIDEYEKGIFDIVVTVTEAHRSPYFNMVKFNLDKTVSLVMPPSSNISRRQDVPLVFDMTTVAYVANSKFVMLQDGIFSGRVGVVEVPKERAVDIDTIYDFRLAEFMLCNSKWNSANVLKE